ncbi:unnamed protein product [Mytilus edulis]|uniref:Uncharacterized protein n=1 Tax=Mytilus edulis TaxID=6550 RepID=A0A8S3RWK8_MYTED|nr:unnamed protein product [Mytilus edulis]
MINSGRICVSTEVRVVVTGTEAQSRVSELKACAKKLKNKLKKDGSGKRSPVNDYRDEYSNLREQMEQVKQCFQCPDDDDHGRVDEDAGGFKRPRTNSPTHAATVHEREPIADYTYSESRNNERDLDTEIKGKKKEAQNRYCEHYVESEMMGKQLKITPCNYRLGDPDRPLSLVNEIADEYKIQLKKMKSNQLQYLKQGIMQKIAKSVDGKVLSRISQSEKQYFEKCLELCWIMVCHSPPIHLDLGF